MQGFLEKLKVFCGDDKRTKRQNGKGFYLLTELGKGSSKVSGIVQIQIQKNTNTNTNKNTKTKNTNTKTKNTNTNLVMGCVQGRIGEWDGTGVIGRPTDKYQLTNTSPLFLWDDGDHHMMIISSPTPAHFSHGMMGIII